MKLLFAVLIFSGSVFADSNHELAGLQQWARAAGVEITSEPQFAQNAERDDSGYSLPTVTVQISSGLTCFYGEFSRNYINNNRPDWYMSCGPNLYHNERYVRRNPKCGTYDYSRFERYANCFSDPGTDASRAVACYRADGRSGGWHRINCMSRDN